MTGHQAFDDLAAEGFLSANELGWARLVKCPRGMRELYWFATRVKALGAWSVAGHGQQIEVTTGGDADSLCFRKKEVSRAESVAARKLGVPPSCSPEEADWWAKYGDMDYPPPYPGAQEGK